MASTPNAASIDPTLFLSEDIRYMKGGIYERGDVVVPEKKVRARANLPFTPRIITLKQPKAKMSVQKKPDSNSSIARNIRPSVRSEGKADPTYAIQELSHLDEALASLDPLPLLPPGAPRLLPREDIRNAQDLDDVATLWRGQPSRPASRDLSVYNGSWVLDHNFPIQQGHTLAIHSHRTLAADEYPVLSMYEMGREEGMVMAPKIRLPVSMDINAFLNSENGRGRVLLGISSERLVKGLFLSLDQKRHVEENLIDLLTLRYSPTVPKDVYSVEFLPVTENPENSSCSPCQKDDCEDDFSSVDLSRRHIFRTGSLCWCDRAALAKIKAGNPPKRFIVDIRVDASGQRVGGRVKALYADEVGCVCVRRGPENAIPSIEELLDDAIGSLERIGF